jgi:hypothetical protein
MAKRNFDRTWVGLSTVVRAERVPARGDATPASVSMSMARNDIGRALGDVLRASENDDPDFSYVGEPVEAEDRGAGST